MHQIFISSLSHDKSVYNSSENYPKILFLVMVRNCLVSYFASAGTYYWRIAVAKPVSRPFLVRSLVKLFSSLNWRPGTLEMRARRLSVLWTLAFYWFNLSPAKLSTCLRAPRRICNHRAVGFFSTPSSFSRRVSRCHGFGVLFSLSLYRHAKCA